LLLFLVLGLAFLFVTWLLGEPYVVARRRRRLRSQPFPAEWRDILKRRMPYFRRLPTDLQIQLKKHILVFVAEKTFIGCKGLVITDEMRVTIAAQACLLILNRRTGYYPNLRQILVYPGAFIVNRVQTDGIGVLQEQRQVLSGESWSQGQVILSWEDALEGAAVPDDGRNVVIHEFAHQLDQESGHANGAPILPRREHYERWSQVMNEEFGKLQEQTRRGEPLLLSHYGATNPAEFFAVVSEVFFEQPQQLAAEYPALYGELGRFYRVDPLSW
jgi:Mlc titration factor MtfA (ptsG expression regulator)